MIDPVTPPLRNNGHPIGNAEACIGSMFNQFLYAASVNAVDASCAAATPPVAFVTPGKQP